MQIGKGKEGVIIGEYGCARKEEGETAELGWIEPAGKNPQWIMWFYPNGDAIIYTQRGPDGEIEGEPIRLKARGVVRKTDKPYASITGNMEVGRIKINGEDHLTVKVDKDGGNLKWVWPDGDVNEIVFSEKDTRDVELVGRTNTIVLRGPKYKLAKVTPEFEYPQHCLSVEAEVVYSDQK